MHKASIMTFLAVALGGALGAVCRYGLSLLLMGATWPQATLLANCLGCFFIGLIAVPLAGPDLSAARALLVVGFLGAFTTYSSLALETWRLAESQPSVAFAYAFGTLILALAACFAGLIVGRLL